VSKKPVGITITQNMNAYPVLDIEYGTSVYASDIAQAVVNQYVTGYDTGTASFTETYAAKFPQYIDPLSAFDEQRDRYYRETQRQRGKSMEVEFGLRDDPKFCDGTESGPIGECPTCNKLVI